MRDLRALFARQKEAEAEQSAAAEARRGCEQDSEKKDSAAQDSLAEEPGPVVDKRKRHGGRGQWQEAPGDSQECGLKGEVGESLVSRRKRGGKKRTYVAVALPRSSR